MLSRIVASVLLFVFFTSLLMMGIRPIGSASRTMIVPDDYPTIQAAINNATDGDTIFVRNGTYFENVIVTKAVSLAGENKYGTIIDGGGVGTVVDVESDNVSLIGFTVRGSATEDGLGIQVRFYNDCNISDNVISDNFLGVSLARGLRNSYCRNTIINNYWGALLFQIQYTTFKGNILANNTYAFSIREVPSLNDIDASNLVDGKPLYYLTNQENIVIGPTVFPEMGYLALVDSTNVTIKDLNTEGVSFNNCANCTIENSTVSSSIEGIGVYYSSGNTISNNTITNNYHGVDIEWNSPDNSVVGNVISGNHDGLYISNRQNSILTVSGNIISGNEWGIYIRFEVASIIYENEISNNSWGGIILLYSMSNRIYHNNFINNTGYGQVFERSGSPNVWDDGYPSGGNYWSDYAGNDTHSGPYQNETGRDGLGDASYAGIDRYPLMNPYVLPICDLNGDWKVNLEDIGTACRTFGSIVGDPKWNPQADINHDGKIDLRDIGLIARNFGKTYR